MFVIHEESDITWWVYLLIFFVFWIMGPQNVLLIKIQGLLKK